MKKTRKIRTNLCMLALGPLILLGISTLVIAAVGIYTATAAETEDGLKNLAHALYRICNEEGNNEYEISDGMILKDGEAFHSTSSVVDDIKVVSGVDASIFYEDTRLLTTVRKKDGTRAIGTKASPEVVETVLEKGQEYFSSSVSVNGTLYFGYYVPLTNNSGGTMGMVFVGKTRSMVIHAVVHTLLGIFLSIGIVGTASALASVFYARKIVYSLDKTKEFLGSIAHGNVEKDIDPYILNRKDEIGEMGDFAVVLKKSINELVSTDPLTGLYNRRTCEVILSKIISDYEKYKSPSVVAIGDIDFFKRVNDTYGHQGGDNVLKELSFIFSEHMRTKGIVARWGGEEFMFIYERMNLEEAKNCLEELINLIREARITYNGMTIQVTMTFGAALCAEGADIDALTKQADDNLYYGKKNGRDQVVFYHRDEE